MVAVFVFHYYLLETAIMDDKLKYYPLSHKKNLLQLILLSKELTITKKLLNQIQEITQSGEDSDFQLGKINTVILDWIQSNK